MPVGKQLIDDVAALVPGAHARHEQHLDPQLVPRERS
jgi:hypothetical protein